QARGQLRHRQDRVIGSDGSLTGYAGGLWRKEKLLEIEGVLRPQPRLF
ncbi:MAG TPA: MGMT family protein, partial [Bacteroidia bacterium]|nr:MGMT family protein [Bacteroidia bacterium]